MGTAIIGKPQSFNAPLATHGEYLKAGRGVDGYISGVITENEIAVVRRVMCYHRSTGLLLETIWSSYDGSYRFDRLIAGVKYFITSIDEHNDAVQYNAVTQDLITASEVTP